MLRITFHKSHRHPFQESLSDFEKSQLGSNKKTYNYTTEEEWDKLRSYLVNKSKKRNPLLDTDLTAYTPGETEALLRHSKIQEWFEKVRSFKVPEKYGTIVFVGCAASKPWGMQCAKGDFYPHYNLIRKDVQSGKIRPLYFVTISEPLGIVPEDFWGDDMNNVFPQYDNPGLFDDVVMRSGMMTKDWPKSPIGQKRELPFDKEAKSRVLHKLGEVIADFISNNKEQHSFVSFVEQADKSKSTHSSMLDAAENISGVQIPRNPKKPFVGRTKQDTDVGKFMRNKLEV